MIAKIVVGILVLGVVAYAVYRYVSGSGLSTLAEMFGRAINNTPKSVAEGSYFPERPESYAPRFDLGPSPVDDHSIVISIPNKSGKQCALFKIVAPKAPNGHNYLAQILQVNPKAGVPMHGVAVQDKIFETVVNLADLQLDCKDQKFVVWDTKYGKHYEGRFKPTKNCIFA